VIVKYPSSCAPPTPGRSPPKRARSLGMGESDLAPLEDLHGLGDGKVETSVSLAERARQREIQRYAYFIPYANTLSVQLGV
jgi:hypothetical protein